MIIAISGLLEDSYGNKRIAGAGKDEAAKALVDHGFVSVAFADVMKRFAVELFGFTAEQCWGASPKRTEPDKRYQRGIRVELAPPDALGIHDAKFVESALTPRYALQKLGDWGRDCYPDIWANKALEIAKELLEDSMSKYPHVMYTPQEGVVDRVEQTSMGEWRRDDEPKKPYKGVVIPDARFQNEFRRVKEEGGTVIRVKRYCTEFPDVMDDSHISERDILEWGDEKFDHVIENVGDVAMLHQKMLVAAGLQSIVFPSVMRY